MSVPLVDARQRHRITVHDLLALGFERGGEQPVFDCPRFVCERDPAEAMEMLLGRLGRSKSNKEFLSTLAAG